MEIDERSKPFTQENPSEAAGSNSSLDANSWITEETCLCKNCHFLKKHFSNLFSPVESAVKTFKSSEAAAIIKAIMQKQHWEPCVKVLAYMGHLLSKITALSPQRCSYCGNFIFGLCENVYVCRSCGIVCHSTCVENIKRNCKEIQSLVKDKEEGLQVQGHKFEKKTWKFRRCAKCKNFVITFIDKCLQCKECKAILHDCCISLLEKNCPSLSLSDGYKGLNDEGNLLSQNFMCPDCNTPIFDESEDCQYCYFSKKFFCLACHSNKEAIIPENVLQKWCFCPHPVSDWSKLFLNYMKDHPVIAAKDISTKVTSFNGEMFNIMLLLEDIKNYYDFLSDCQKEFDDILEQIRKNWPNLLQSPLNFSLSNLHNIFASFEEAKPSLDALYPQLVACHEKVIHHVRRECQKCIGQAQKCMACDCKGAYTTTENAIFYFERTVISCKNKRCTPLNCVHRSCLKKNPFFVCKGCDTQMLKCEEFSLLCIKLPAQQAPKSKEGICGSVSKTEEIEIEPEASEMTCHNISKEITQTSTQKLKEFMNGSCMGACGTSEGALVGSTNIQRSGDSENVPKDLKFSVSTSILHTGSPFDKTAKGQDKYFAQNEHVIKSLEHYLVFGNSADLKQRRSASSPEQRALCSSLFKQLQTDSAAGTDLQFPKSLPSQSGINTEQSQQQSQNMDNQNLHITQCLDANRASPHSTE